MNWSLVFARTVLADALLGACAAGVLGAVAVPDSVMMPFIGGGWLAAAGGFAGGAFGLVDGWLRAMIVTFLHPTMPVIRSMAALVYAPVGAFLGSVGGQWPVAVGCAALAAVTGAFVGPLTAYGVRLDPVQRRWWRSSLILLAAAVVVGALLGLGVGLSSYSYADPHRTTAAAGGPFLAVIGIFAMMEGASTGAGCGIVTVVLLTLGWLPFLRPDLP